MTRFGEFRAGVRDVFPLMIGIIPFGAAFGILGLEAGLSPWQTFLLSSILFAGTSQIIFAQMIALAAPAFVLFSSVAALNARHLLYSASLSPYLRDKPLTWRLLLAYFMTDEAYAVSIVRYQNQPANEHMHYHLLGSGFTLWAFWQASTALGILAGTAIPDSLELGFAIPLIFMVIVLPLIKGRHEIVTILAAGAIVVEFQYLPYNSWLLLAAVTGICAGTLSYLYDKRQER